MSLESLMVPHKVPCGWVINITRSAKLWGSTSDGVISILWLFNIAMENGPFIDGLPIRNGDLCDFPWLC